MKKVISSIITISLLSLLTACGNGTNSIKPTTNNSAASDSSSSESEAESNSKLTEAGHNAVIVYFSHSGNTEKIAQIIADDTGNDLFEIIPSVDYPDDYDDCVDLAQDEQNENARPEIANKLENIVQYDTVYLGYPCWWGTCPMIIFTFLEEYDLTGKTIIPFTTHGGSGFGNSIDDIKKICPDSKILDGLAIRDSKFDDSKDTVKEWLAKINY